MTTPVLDEEQKSGGLPATFWLLTCASALSKFGNTFLMLAVPWVLLESSNSALVAGLGVAVQYLPYAVSPVLGALIDRFDRRWVFIASEIGQAALVACVPIALHFDATAVSLVLLLLVGVGNVVSNLTTDYSLVPDLLHPSQLALGYSRYGTLTQSARFIGPVGAGIVIGRFGATPALLFDAATFLVTAAVALKLPIRDHAVPKVGFGAMMSTGLKGFLSTPRISHLSIALALYNIGTGALAALVAFTVQQGWGWSADVAGLLLSLIALGAAAGAWLAGRVWQGRPVVDRVGPWLAVCTVGGLITLVPSPIAIAAGLAVLGMGEGGMTATTNAYRGQAIPPELAGRVNSLIRAVAMTAVLVSPFVVDGVTKSFASMSLWFAPIAICGAIAWLVWQLPARRAVPESSN